MSKLVLRYIVSGAVEVEAPKNWDSLTDEQKSTWAEGLLAETSDEDLLNPIIINLEEDKPQIEAVENVDKDYQLEVKSKLWSAYLGEEG